MFLTLGIYGFANGGIVSHTPEQITPQGPGSGLDADTLDGLHSSDILAQINNSGHVKGGVYGKCVQDKTTQGWCKKTVCYGSSAPAFCEVLDACGNICCVQNEYCRCEQGYTRLITGRDHDKYYGNTYYSCLKN